MCPCSGCGQTEVSLDAASRSSSAAPGLPGGPPPEAASGRSKQIAARRGGREQIKGPRTRSDPEPRGDTVERPKCECETPEKFIYSATGAPAPTNTLRFRFAVSIQSSVRCDRGTPGNCEYRYVVKAQIQKQARLQPNPPAPPAQWTTDNTRAAFVQKFRVHDDVNQEWNYDRVDQSEAEIGLWREKAPRKEQTKVTIVLAPSVRGGIKPSLDETVELCVPTGATPNCPPT